MPRAKKKTTTPHTTTVRFRPGSARVAYWLAAAFFVMAWAWAAWLMGDTMRMAREWSFFAADATLMRFLLEQPAGWLWAGGRAMLSLYRWPVAGGMLVAALLTATTAATAYAIRSATRSWRAVPAAVVPACAWMTWAAWQGLNLYYQAEPGRAMALLAAMTAAAAVAAVAAACRRRQGDTTATTGTAGIAAATAAVAIAFVIPTAVSRLRHPYLRPVARMQVQMLNSDWQGMVATARDNATLSYRPLAAYYAIALVHTGHLTDALFDIRMDYDSLRISDYGGKPYLGTTYYLADCNYAAGLFRTAEHNAMELLTMNGPTLHALKHLTRLALLDGAWPLAEKYLHIIARTPFEGDFVERYAAMVGNAGAVAADPEFARLRLTEPAADSFESQHQKPTFLGYTATLMAGRSTEALMQSLMANLYSKRMPDFIMRTQPLVGTTPPRSIAEGLATQTPKNPDILKAFPQLQMNVQAYQGFVQNVKDALKDRPAHARELFDTYRGYYPYYYFFGNLKATRKAGDSEHATSNAGVN